MAKKSGKSDPSDRIIDAALQLAAKRGWHMVGLGDIASAADMPLAELYRVHRSKSAILEAFRRRIDEAVLAGTDDSDENENPRDRLFDVLMRRFDALKPYREAIAGLMRAGSRDPLAVLPTICGVSRSMGWMLEAAGISAAGPLGRLRTQGLAAIWLATMPSWVKDESEDLSGTMAALDRNLKRAENLMKALPRWTARSSRGATEAA
jgi:AcrR family transcriptional regulator